MLVQFFIVHLDVFTVNSPKVQSIIIRKTEKCLRQLDASTFLLSWLKNLQRSRHLFGDTVIVCTS